MWKTPGGGAGLRPDLEFPTRVRRLFRCRTTTGEGPPRARRPALVAAGIACPDSPCDGHFRRRQTHPPLWETPGSAATPRRSRGVFHKGSHYLPLLGSSSLCVDRIIKKTQVASKKMPECGGRAADPHRFRPVPHGPRFPGLGTARMPGRGAPSGRPVHGNPPEMDKKSRFLGFSRLRRHRRRGRRGAAPTHPRPPPACILISRPLPYLLPKPPLLFDKSLKSSYTPQRPFPGGNNVYDAVGNRNCLFLSERYNETFVKSCSIHSLVKRAKLTVSCLFLSH